MVDKVKNHKFTPYAVALAVVILLLLAFSPKQKPAVAPSVMTPPVTVDNEFDQAKPDGALTLTVTSPAHQSTSSTQTILVKGKTVPHADVFVNEKEGKAETGGNFSVSYMLEEGDNYLLVTANDEQGNYNEIQLVVRYE